MSDWNDKAQRYRDSVEEHVEEGVRDMWIWWKGRAKWVAVALLALGVVLVAYHVQ